MKKIDQADLAYWIHHIAWEILEEIVCPACDISYVIEADLYRADLSCYSGPSETEIRSIMATRIVFRYKLHRDYIELIMKWPLALIALLILEKGKYK